MTGLSTCMQIFRVPLCEHYFTVQAYEQYFKALDQTGGFFYERWGDAPVHSLGAVMLLNSTEVSAYNVGIFAAYPGARVLETLRASPVATTKWPDLARCPDYLIEGVRHGICSESRVRVGLAGCQLQSLGPGSLASCESKAGNRRLCIVLNRAV